MLIVALALTTLFTFTRSTLQFAVPYSSYAYPTDPVFSLDSLADLPESWCLVGSFQEWENGTHPLNDEGVQGDVSARDGIYSLEITVVAPGEHEWQIVDCADWSQKVPLEVAWVTTTEPGQTLLFTLDLNNYARQFVKRGYPRRFIVNVNDSHDAYTVIGDFQNWNNSDPETKLRRLNKNVYWRIEEIAEPGEHQSYIVVSETWHAFGADGRSLKPVPLNFTTAQPNEPVVFMLERDSGRVTILYDLPPIFQLLGSSSNAIWLGFAFLTLTLLATLMLMRYPIMYRRRWWIKRGCPNCSQPQLKRIRRQGLEPLLDILALPLRRYHCLNCDWAGLRVDQDRLD